MMTKQISSESVEKKQKPTLNQERVRELFDYYPKTGVFTRNITTDAKAVAGSIVGYNFVDSSNHRKYPVMTIDGKAHFHSRVAWLWYYGELPKHRIGYLNGNKLDLSIDNLVEIKPTENMPLTQERVKYLFDYDPDTGIVTNRAVVALGQFIGKVVGRKNDAGYLTVRVDGVVYRLHRIIWLWMEGYLPETDVDHIDHDPSNNSWSNLRVISHLCNCRNCKVSKNNKSGVSGVSWAARKESWTAQIMIHYKTTYIKRSKDLTEAVAHRLAAEQALGWDGCDSTSSAFLYMKAYVNGEDMQSYINEAKQK